jgi:hypothetical protein
MLSTFKRPLTEESMQLLAITLFLLLLGPTWVGAEEQLEAMLYKQPFCGCCDGHADHLRASGYKVTVMQTDNLTLIEKKYGVPQEFEGCHNRHRRLCRRGACARNNRPQIAERASARSRNFIAGHARGIAGYDGSENRAVCRL